VNSDRLEKVQLNAAKLMMGLLSFSSSLYYETGCEILQKKRKQICTMYKILNCESPSHFKNSAHYFLRNCPLFNYCVADYKSHKIHTFPLWDDLTHFVRKFMSILVLKNLLKKVI